MIEALEGVLAAKTPSAVTVDVAGVGFLVQVPLSTYEALPDEGRRVRLLTHLLLREDGVRLFGFATDAERQLFLKLIGVNRVGPGVALQVLSSCSVDDFTRYVMAGDVTMLSKLVKGVGKKMAQRLVLELRGELAEAAEEGTAAAAAGVAHDAVTALMNLGESPAAARRGVQKALKNLGPDADVESVVRRVLSP
jgi:Holliday junction DNA helicase RuvA